MATRDETVAHLMDALPGTTVKKMFGEYGIYLGPKMVGMICDDQLYLRPSDAARAVLPDLPLAPPYPGAKPYLLADAALDDPERLMAALRVIADEAPLPKPRKKKT
jgi:TfoX/Sxy family transcriptional regulator of competence genes